MPPTNKAAWLPSINAGHFEVGPAPYTPPHANEIVIKNRAIAVNPLDWILPIHGDLTFTWIKYPFIIGTDISGEVVEVGKQVTRFKVGDRVVGLATGTDSHANNHAQSAFQQYTVLQPDSTSHIPSNMSFESAAVLPLGLGTAASGLFQKDQLGLQYPSIPRKPTGKTLLVWGGSTSVGCNAIQLGVAAGYEVFTTASPKNFELVTKLGASKVFDYSSPSVIPDIIKALQGKSVAGAISIADDSAYKCMKILEKSKGHKFVAIAAFPKPKKEPVTLVKLRTIWFFASWIILWKLKGFFKGVNSSFIFGSSLAFAEHHEVGKTVFVDFLPKALETGVFVAAPEPYLFGKGIESIQGACDLQKKGVSASKIVVSL